MALGGFGVTKIGYVNLSTLGSALLVLSLMLDSIVPNTSCLFLSFSLTGGIGGGLLSIPYLTVLYSQMSGPMLPVAVGFAAAGGGLAPLCSTWYWNLSTRPLAGAMLGKFWQQPCWWFWPWTPWHYVAARDKKRRARMTQWKSLTPHHLIHHLALSHLSFGLVESWLNWFARSPLQVSCFWAWAWCCICVDLLRHILMWSTTLSCRCTRMPPCWYQSWAQGALSAASFVALTCY